VSLFKVYIKFLLAWLQQCKVTITNLVTYLDFITLLIISEGQVGDIYLDLSRSFDLVSHNSLLHKLSPFELSYCYVKWFCSYLTNRQSLESFYRLWLCSLMFHRDLS
jgi:hypothetical protein